MKSALVLFSGGQDSTVCLAWALNAFDTVHTIGFDYGQRHAVELECRKHILDNIESVDDSWRNKLDTDSVIDMSFIATLGETAMTSEMQIRINESGLPNTFVPGRNVFFLTAAASCAYRLGVNNLVGGMCETDYSGYPDCRNDALQSLSSALTLCMDSEITLHTPLMWKDKAATWQMAEELGKEELVELIITESHTCYTGERTELHPWGYGCATCPACLLRKHGFEQWSGTQT